MGRDADFNHGLPLGQPSIREWELTSNSTRFDKILAAPSDEDLRVMWITYSGLLIVLSFYMITIFLALATNKKIRRKSFNLYLIYLMVPDIVFSAFCATTCAWLAFNDGFHQHSGYCRFQSFYLIFGICANAWINGVIGYHVLKMLRISHAGQRYAPPKLRAVTRNAICIYIGAIFVASWGVVPFSWLPHETNLQNGIYCIPVEYDQTSLIFFWTAYIPFFFLIPLVYCIGGAVYTLWYRLLPPSGRRRELAVYFFRILVVFVIMWLPFIVGAFAMGGAGGHPWAVWAAGLWAHFQGAVSASAILLKADIRKAVIRFVTCKKKINAFADTDSSGSNDDIRMQRRRSGQVLVYGLSEGTEESSAFWTGPRSVPPAYVGGSPHNFTGKESQPAKPAGSDSGSCIELDDASQELQPPPPPPPRRESISKVAWTC